MTTKGNERPETIEFWKWLNKSGVVDDFVFAIVNCLNDMEHIPPKSVLNHVYCQLNLGKSLAQKVKDALIIRQDMEQQYQAITRQNEKLLDRLEVYEPGARMKKDSSKSDSEKGTNSDDGDDTGKSEEDDVNLREIPSSKSTKSVHFESPSSTKTGAKSHS